MSKDEKLRKNAGNNMAESVGVGVALGLPPGMAPEAALGRPAHLEGLTRAKNLVEIAVTQIVRDDKQPRVVFSEAEMDDLVQSVTARGILQPIRVRWNTDLGKYVIVAGERRFRAARQAGLRAVPCVIHEGAMTESTILQDQLVENLLRQDLQPIETAKAYCRLMELEGWSARQLARELHVPDANIVRALALLELPETVQQQVADGRLAPSVAYEVSKLDRPEDQAELAERVVTEKLTRDQAIEAVKVKKPGRAEMAKRTKEEIRLDDGHRVTITGPAVAVGGRAAIRAVLARAAEQLDTEDHDQARDEAA